MLMMPLTIGKVLANLTIILKKLNKRKSKLMNINHHQFPRKRKLKVNPKNKNLKNKKMLISKKILIAFRSSMKKKMLTKINYIKNHMKQLSKILQLSNLMKRKQIRKKLDLTQSISWTKNLKKKLKNLRRNQPLHLKINKISTSKFGRNHIQKTQRELLMNKNKSNWLKKQKSYKNRLKSWNCSQKHY